jgi:hypothetical protein
MEDASASESHLANLVWKLGENFVMRYYRIFWLLDDEDDDDGGGSRVKVRPIH